MGLRYEWSTPYTERFNRLSWSDFSGDSGIDVPRLGRIHGVNRLADSEKRTINSDRNNFGPRLGFAFRPESKNCPTRWRRSLLRLQPTHQFSICQSSLGPAGEFRFL